MSLVIRRSVSTGLPIRRYAHIAQGPSGHIVTVRSKGKRGIYRASGAMSHGRAVALLNRYLSLCARHGAGVHVSPSRF